MSNIPKTPWPGPGIPPVGHTPPPPKPPNKPDGYGPLPPPIPPMGFVPGMNVQEQLFYMGGKVNECIDRWNHIQDKCYEAMNRAVGAAMSNGVYYDPDEVRLEQGYSEVDGCPFSVAFIKPLDKSGSPIHMKLVCAYNNTTDSGVTQAIDEVSFITNAQLIMTAVEGDFWYGTTMMDGYPIAHKDGAGKILAILHNGHMRVFDANTDVGTLRQNGVMNCIGPVTPIILNGVETDEAKADVVPRAFTVLGYKPITNETVMFWCGNYDVPGCTPSAISTILRNMGVSIAVITSNSGACEYMGEFTATPKDFEPPKAPAYWVVTKRPTDGWSNDWAAEVANLIQNMGKAKNDLAAFRRQLTSLTERTETAEGQIEDLTDDLADANARITELEKLLSDTENGILAKLNAEIERAKNAEKALEEKNAEQDAAITAEVQRATDNENRIETESKQRDTAETTRAEAAETRLEGLIKTEQARAEEAEMGLGHRITDEVQRASNEEARIEAESRERDRAESERAKDAEATIDAQSKLRDAEETKRAEAAEKDLSDDIEAEKNRATSEEQSIEAKLSHDLEDEKDRATAEEKRIEDSLKLAIEGEKQRAEGEEKRIEDSLNLAIDTAKAEATAQVEAEKQRATGEEKRIEDSLTLAVETAKTEALHAVEDEKDRAEAEEKRIESTLQQGIDGAKLEAAAALASEVNRATAEEKRIEDSLTAAVETEKARAEAAETQLHDEIHDWETRLNDETEARIAGDAAEAAAREAADTAMQTQIEAFGDVVHEIDVAYHAMSDRMDGAESGIDTLKKRMTNAENKMSGIEDRLPVDFTEQEVVDIWTNN